MSNMDRALNPWAHQDTPGPGDARKAPAPPSAGTTLYVPAHPQPRTPGSGNTPGRLVFELLSGPGGDPVPVAFTSLDLLVERLGDAQPWAALPAQQFAVLMHRAGFEPIRIDPQVLTGVRRWTPSDWAGYEKGADA